MLKKAALKDAFSQLGRIMRSASDGMKLYQITDGEMRAASSSMMGGVPLDYDGSFCVSGEPFEKVVNAMAGDLAVEVGNRTLQIISGKSRLALPKLESDMLRGKSHMTGVIVELDRDFNELAKACTSVINEARVLDWQSTLVIAKGHMIGMDKGQLLVCAKYEPLSEVENALLPLDIVDIIIGKKTPVRELVFSPDAVLVDFQDDSWVQGQLVSGSVPTKLFELMTKLQDCENAITQEQRSAIAQAAALDATVLEIEPTRMVATTDNGELVIDVESPVTKKTRWNARIINKAVGLATHWDLERFPEPAVLSSSKLKLMMASQAA